MSTAALILIADDEAPIRYMLAAKFRGAGFSVIEAPDGELAFDEVQKARPALVVSDFQMPWMSGLELCTKLRATPGLDAIPVIMLTARGHLVSREDLANTNIKEVIAKPFSARQVVEAATRLLEGGAAGRSAA